MLVPCEIAIKCVLPPVRAMIAKELMTKYNLKQAKAAKLLGVSQPAISLYNRKMRGRAIELDNDKDINILIQNFADSLIKAHILHKEFILLFCEICRIIRAKGLMCELHKTFDPSADIEGCDLCIIIATRCVK